MALYQTRSTDRLDKVDPVWSRIRTEAEEIVRREPELATFIYSTILHHNHIGSGGRAAACRPAATGRTCPAT